MKKLCIFLTGAALLSGLAQGNEFNIGFVNFKNCIEKSKHGQQEKNALEAMKKQMAEMLEKTDKELEEISKKLEDQDYMDGLSPTAEEELKGKFQVLNQEFSRYQTQYYQLLNQANYKMLQSLHQEVSSAAEKVRKQKELSLILNEDSTFAYEPSLDFTGDVIQQMDKQYENMNANTLNKAMEGSVQ